MRLNILTPQESESNIPITIVSFDGALRKIAQTPSMYLLPSRINRSRTICQAKDQSNLCQRRETRMNTSSSTSTKPWFVRQRCRNHMPAFRPRHQVSESSKSSSKELKKTMPSGGGTSDDGCPDRRLRWLEAFEVFDEVDVVALYRRQLP